MKQLYQIIILIFASTSFIFAQNAAETLMNKGQGIVLGGYGEVHVNLPEDGNGKVDVHRLVTKNYSGWLVVEAEQDPAKANPFEYAKIGYKYLTETLNSSNIEIFKN